MKQYPSITGQRVDINIHAFAKLDGSNIRAEWSRKQNQFTKFGSRHVLIDEKSDSILVKSIPLIRERYEKKLSDWFKSRGLEQVTCFFEFYGPHSFAGVHDTSDDGCFTVTLFDLDIYKRGLLPPNEFLKHTSAAGVEIAELLYVGNPTQPFIESVKEGLLPGVPFEGVVCKGMPLKKGYPPTMFKVKTNAWIEKVKGLYGNDENKLKELL